MRIVLALCIVLIASSSIHAQNQPAEPPVFDKKFWTTTGIMAGSTVILTETAARQQKNGRPDIRLKAYTAAGISDFLVFAISANAKSDEKKWWWVMPIATAALNGSFTIKYAKRF